MGCAKSKDKLERKESDQLEKLTNFSSNELKNCYEDFIKVSASGQMNRQQFEDFYAKIFLKDTDKNFVEHLFRTYDFNGDGFINFKEFVCGLSITTRGTTEEKLTWTFNVYDVNNDGKITKEEMGEIMRSIYAMNDVTLPEQIQSGQDAFQGLDTDGDGLISVAEFVKGVQKDERLVKMLNRTIQNEPIPTEKN